MSAPRYEHGAMGTGSNRELVDLGNLSNAENEKTAWKNPANVCVFGEKGKRQRVISGSLRGD